MDGKNISEFEGLHLWKVKATRIDETLQFLTPTNDVKTAAAAAKRWLRRKGFTSSCIVSIESEGTIDA